MAILQFQMPRAIKKPEPSHPLSTKHPAMPDQSPCLLPLDEAVLTRTLADWKSSHPEMGVLALLPMAEKDQLATLQDTCRRLSIPLTGGIFPELVTENGFSSSGVWLLRFDQMIPAFLISNLGGPPGQAAARIASSVEPDLDRLGTRPTLYLVVDALLQHIATMLDELYLRLADRVTYAGVAAGNETFLPTPCVFDANRAISGGALALLIPDDVKTVLEHGFVSPENVMTATATIGNRIVSIDWKPAFEVYRDIVRAERDVVLDRGNFYQWAVSYPFGILRANGELVVRIPVALADDDSVFCIGEVPENAMLVVLRAPDFETDNCAEILARKITENTVAGMDANLLVFYCAGRRLHLKSWAEKEIRKLGECSGAKKLAGALSLGEIGSTTPGGYPLFHNATLVCTPLSRA